jgi:hypothetical protein
VKVKESKAIAVTGRGGPQGCETSRFLHFLNNRLTNGRKVVSFRRFRKPEVTLEESTHLAEQRNGPKDPSLDVDTNITFLDIIHRLVLI